MKIIKIIPISLVVFLFMSIFSASAQDAAEILKKMDQVIFAPKDKQATVQIITYKNDKEDKVREAELFEKGPEMKIYRYTKPESQAGIATLSLPGDIMWMKMPAFDKPKKISMLAKSQALNNTDFAWEDIPRQPYSDRYTSKFSGLQGNELVVELAPISDKSSYSRLIAHIDKTNYYPVKIEYYDKGGKMEKVASYTYKKTGNYWNAVEVEMTDLKKKTATKITMTDVKFDQGLPDDLFTEEKFWQ